jgi:hypothetical protein
VAHTGKIGAGIGRAKGLGDTSDHLSETEQIALLHTTLDKTMAGHQGKLEVDTGEDLTDAGALQEPICANLTDLVGDLGIINLILVSISNDNLAARVLLCQFLHATEHKTTEVIKDVGQENELLRVEERRLNIVEKLGALDGNTHAGDFVFLFPELFHFLVKALELLGEVLSGYKSAVPSLSGGCGSSALLFKLVKSALTLTHSDSALHIIRALAVAETDFQVLGLRSEHIEYLNLLGLPVLEFSIVVHVGIHLA